MDTFFFACVTLGNRCDVFFLFAKTMKRTTCDQKGRLILRSIDLSGDWGILINLLSHLSKIDGQREREREGKRERQKANSMNGEWREERRILKRRWLLLQSDLFIFQEDNSTLMCIAGFSPACPATFLGHVHSSNEWLMGTSRGRPELELTFYEVVYPTIHSFNE